MAQEKIEDEIKVGLFVCVGILLTMVTILILGGPGSLFSSTNRFFAHFNSVEGLIPGAKVILSGVNVGAVESVDFDHEKRDIRIQFSVTKDATPWIREDSTVELATQGVLGDKYLAIKAGSEKFPTVASGSTIVTRLSPDISHFINRGDQLMVVLTRISESMDQILSSFESEGRSEAFFKGIATTAKNFADLSTKMNQQMNPGQLNQAITELKQILEKINNGTGTLSALINDPGLYDELRALVGGANRNRVFRNLIRQTIKRSEEGGSSPAEPPPSKK